MSSWIIDRFGRLAAAGLAAIVLAASPAPAVAADDKPDRPEKDKKELTLAVGYYAGIYGSGFSHGAAGRVYWGDEFFIAAGLAIAQNTKEDRLAVHPQLGVGMYFSGLGEKAGRVGIVGYPLAFAVVDGKGSYLPSIGLSLELFLDDKIGFYAFPNAGAVVGGDETGGYGALEAGLVGHF